MFYGAGMSYPPPPKPPPNILQWYERGIVALEAAKARAKGSGQYVHKGTDLYRAVELARELDALNLTPPKSE